MLYTLSVTVDLADDDEASMVLADLVLRSESYAAIRGHGWTSQAQLQGVEWAGR